MLPCLYASKHQNPREGIKTGVQRELDAFEFALPSKHQNPREGIKTHSTAKTGLKCKVLHLQNTKIPVRGLKLLKM